MSGKYHPLHGHVVVLTGCTFGNPRQHGGAGSPTWVSVCREDRLPGEPWQGRRKESCRLDRPCKEKQTNIHFSSSHHGLSTHVENYLWYAPPHQRGIG